MIKPVVWSMKELAEMTKQRILNKFDSNIAVTGDTGIGKSTFCFKFFYKFPDFKIEDQLIYKRSEMIDLIKNYNFSYCWNDEFISSGYKRSFFDQEQIELIKVLTKYRNNFNIVAGAVPIFFTLDKELLKLFGMHINIIERGIAVVHLPREGRMYTDDIWDVKINSKLEEKWSNKKMKNPNFKIPYHRYTTFAGYIYFGALTEKQEKYYDYLKSKKRDEGERLAKEEGKQSKENFYEKVLRMVKEKKLDEDGLFNLCQFHDKKLSSVKVNLNRMLKDEGSKLTLKNLLVDKNNNKDNKLLHNNTVGLKDVIIDL